MSMVVAATGGVTEGIGAVASTGVTGTVHAHIVVAVVAGTGISGSISVVIEPGDGGINLAECSLYSGLKLDQIGVH